MMKYRLLFTMLLALTLNPALAQQPRPVQGGQQGRSQGPVLIKDFEQPGEKGEKVYPHDPKEARRNVDVGKYYFKRDNYEAAAKRFSEAIEYDISWPESYKKLIETFDKLKDYGSAVDICKKFAENNPESGEIEYFRKAETKYQEKQEKQKAENPEEKE